MSSQEVNDAVGEGPARDTAESLERRAAELRRILERPSEKERAAAELAEVEGRIAAAKEQGTRVAAEKRSVGISRAVGSIAALIEGDDQKVVEAAEAFVAAVEQLNARYRQFEGLVAEDAALRDRFGISGAKIPPVVSPNEREKIVAAVRTIQAVPYATAFARGPSLETDEHGLRHRRTYEEIGDCEGARIIASAGLKPFRDLTARERRAVESVGRQREANVEHLAELGVETTIAKAIPWMGPATVHRG